MDMKFLHFLHAIVAQIFGETEKEMELNSLNCHKNSYFRGLS